MNIHSYNKHINREIICKYCSFSAFLNSGKIFAFRYVYKNAPKKLKCI